jgi:hypothetical protein
MKYAEMGLGAMIYIPSLINSGPAIQRLVGGGGCRDTTTHRHAESMAIAQASFYFSK